MDITLTDHGDPFIPPMIPPKDIETITLAADHNPGHPNGIYATISTPPFGSGHLYNVFSLSNDGTKWFPDTNNANSLPGIDTQGGLNQVYRNFTFWNFIPSSMAMVVWRWQWSIPWDFPISR